VLSSCTFTMKARDVSLMSEMNMPASDGKMLGRRLRQKDISEDAEPATGRRRAPLGLSGRQGLDSGERRIHHRRRSEPGQREDHGQGIRQVGLKQGWIRK